MFPPPVRRPAVCPGNIREKLGEGGNASVAHRVAHPLGEMRTYCVKVGIKPGCRLVIDEQQEAEPRAGGNALGSVL